MSKLVVVGLLLVVAAVLLSGCGGGGEQIVFQNILERVTWNNTATRLAFTSLGGNAVAYISSINSTGGGLKLLTPSDNDDDLTDEGGKQPSWSPDGVDLAIVARRGGGQAIFVIDPINGSTSRETKLTDDTIPGADAQPSWKADSTQIVYVSNKGGTGRFEIFIMNRDGTGNAMIARDDANDAQWPVFTPDGLSIVYQSRIAGPGVDTSIRILTIATGITTALDATEANGFREEAPAVTPDGLRVAFHSNRNGDFDIWVINIDGTSPAFLTRDTRSDGYPVWNFDASRLAFTRDRELWTMAADGSDQDRLTRRFEEQQ